MVFISIYTEIKFLPRNATHLRQPLDLFTTHTVKCVCRMNGSRKSLILRNNLCYCHRHLEKVLNPGKQYFVSLAVMFVCEVNAMINHDRIPLIQRAMIRCAITLNRNGC